MPNINGSIEQVNIWNNSKITTGVITTESKGTKLPSSASENATGCKISINFGNGEYHNNLQPSKAVYRFKRTAWLSEKCQHIHIHILIHHTCFPNVILQRIILSALIQMIQLIKWLTQQVVRVVIHAITICNHLSLFIVSDVLLSCRGIASHLRRSMELRRTS